MWAVILPAQDFTPPTVLCKSSPVVSLSYGEHYISATDIDNGSYDNVGIKSYSIRKMSDLCGISSNLEFGNRIKLCCDEVNSRFMVVLQVEDLSGNIGQCMTEISVQDKTVPTISCLPDITVSCKYKGYSPSEFGTFTNNPSDRKKIIIDGKFWGLDGVYATGCGQLPIQESRNFIKGNCSTSFDILERRFFFPQFPGQECIQRITFVPDNTFDIRDNTCFNEDPTDGVIWPCDYETRDCDPQGGLSPDVTGRPDLIRGDQCGLVGTSYSDQRFDIEGSACKKILREWFIFDWCTNRMWSYTQKILVYESNKPVIETCGDTVLTSFDQNCQTASFNERILASDDCTVYDSLDIRYKLDIYSDGTIDTTVFSDSIAQVLPFGAHLLYIDIDDNCSNVSSCARKITVVDGKKPTPVCRNGVVTVLMPITGSVRIPATYFNVDSYDNCTAPEDLAFSYSENIDDKTYTIDCDSISLNGSDTFDVKVFVTDESGLNDHCTVSIVAQDPNNICASTITATIKGHILGGQNISVNNIQVQINDAKQNLQVTNINVEDNKYEKTISIPSALLDEGMVIKASKNDDVTAGISVADIVALQRHLLGIERIKDPAILLAADANGSGKLTAKDLVVLRKLILGLDDSFPNNTPPWHFLDADELKYGNMSTTIQMNSNTSGRPSYDFHVVKTGDLNKSWSINSELESRNNDFVFYIEKDFSPEQSLIGFSIKAEDFSSLTGFQGTFEYDPFLLEFVNIIPGALEVTDANLNLNRLTEGLLPFVWDNKEGIAISPDEVLFTLFFRTKVKEPNGNTFNLNFGSNTVLAQGVNADGKVIKVIFNPKVEDNSVEKEAIYDAYPNPVSGFVNFPIDLLNDEDVTFDLFSVTGRHLRTYTFRLLKGKREVSINISELSTEGVLIARIEAGELISTQRIVVLPE